jgi:indolepyruvate ferredoxin oxidoreductase alpha subunit
LNEFFDGDLTDVGIILQGGMYNGVMRALMKMGLADIWGATRVPLYVLNVTYPLVDDEVIRFCDGKRSVLVVEEGQPDFIEQALSRVLREADLPTRLLGKKVLPMAGEYTVAVLEEGVRAFVSAAGLASELTPRGNAAAVLDEAPVRALATVVPARPPGFCTGCPERPIFSAMKLVEQELGEHHIAADIGCHLFSILPPFGIGASTMGYGLGPASASALNGGEGRRVISFMGDGGFWHNGLASSIGNAVYNKSDSVVVVVDNHYSAATGGQDLLSSRAVSRRRSTGHTIVRAVRGVGATWVRSVGRTYDVARMRDTLRAALTTVARGPKVIVASSECMLNRQRREKPLMAAAIKAGRRVVRPRFGVDQDVCTGDHACMRLSGCPSLSLKHTGEKLRDDPVAVVDNSCVGCGHCGEVANAAVLCPSFYRADVVENPSLWDRVLARMRSAVIGWLQRRRAGLVQG